MREFSLNYQIILKSIPHNLTISSPSGFTPLDEFFSVTGKKILALSVFLWDSDLRPDIAVN